MSTTSAPSSFHVLTKPTGAICNLDCKYCFFLSKEELYPNSKFRMTDEVLDRYIRQQCESQAGLPEVNISWQGGEPTLMGLDFFQRSVEFSRKYQRPGQPVQYTIQTRPTGRSWTTPGARSSRSIASWSGSPWTARRRCTTPIGWTRAGTRPSTRSWGPRA